MVDFFLTDGLAFFSSAVLSSKSLSASSIDDNTCPAAETQVNSTSRTSIDLSVQTRSQRQAFARETKGDICTRSEKHWRQVQMDANPFQAHRSKQVRRASDGVSPQPCLQFQIGPSKDHHASKHRSRTCEQTQASYFAD